MKTENESETVPPTDIVKGDVIEGPIGGHWLRVREIRILTDAVHGAFSFYARPDDRVTFEGSERVRRKI